MKKSLKDGETIKGIEIPIKSLNPMKYHLIPIRNVRSLFPGYKIPFTFETDIGNIQVHVTSAESKGVKKGTPNVGRYIKSPRKEKLNEWFEKHKELKIGDKFLIDIKKPNKLYKLNVEKIK